MAALLRLTAANLLALAHACLEVWAFWLLLAGPLWAGALVLLLVGGLMWAHQGRCILTLWEHQLRRRRVPSMTRRLLHWGSLRLIPMRSTRRLQWWIMGGAVVWWLARANPPVAQWLAWLWEK